MPAGFVIGAIGVGMSAASAAGAFSGSVDKPIPTGEELDALKAARQSYALGRKIQSPLDALSRQDLRYLGSDQALANAGSEGVNAMWRQAGPVGSGLYEAAAASGGPGSGRFWGQMGNGMAALDSGVRQANVQGRLGGLNQYLARQGQFLARRTNDLKTGMDTMTVGAAQAAANQNARIQAQVQSNIAANQAMGQLGGALTSFGMGMAGGIGGGAGGASGGPAPYQGNYVSSSAPAYYGPK